MAELLLFVEHRLPMATVGGRVGTATCLICGIPVVLSLPFTLFVGRLNAISIMWVAIFSVLSAGTLLLARHLWLEVRGGNADIDEFLNTDANRTRAGRFVSRVGSMGRQVAFAVSGGVLATVSLGAIDARGLVPPPTSVVSYVVVGLSGALVAGGMYMGIYGALFVRLLSLLDDVCTPRIVPASSPALWRLARMFVAAALGGAILMVMAALPLSYMGWSSNFDGEMLGLLGFMFVSGLIALSFGAGVPQYWLSCIVGRERHRTIVELQTEIWNLASSGDLTDTQRMQGLLVLLDKVIASPKYTISPLLRFGSAMSIAVVPLLIAEMVRNLVA